ncbi:MAG: hypothetical protein GQ535_05730 [Rhodobacteraceae bacterium]|nr:hypothetical protein [Paracoccaceae bacterium]
MSSLIDRVADLLYPEDGPTTLDIKFFSGGMSNVSAVDLAEQVLRSNVQIQSGSAVLVDDIDSYLI